MFDLDSRLAADTLILADLPLCRVLLMRDARYPWLILVPRVADISEVYQLDEAAQVQLWLETRALAQGMQQEFAARKMNIAALGNVVSQLHMHVVARQERDAAWPAPVWGHGEAQAYSAEALQTVRQRMLHVLQRTGLEVQVYG